MSHPIGHHYLTVWREVQRQSWRFVQQRDRPFQGIYIWLPRPTGGWKLALWVRTVERVGIRKIMGYYTNHRQALAESLEHVAWLWRRDVNFLVEEIGDPADRCPEVESPETKTVGSYPEELRN